MAFRDGDSVNCEKCGKSVTVKLASSDISVGTPETLRTMAFKCQDCGYVACGSCVFPATDLTLPTCPSCKSEGGPYFFKR